VYWQYYGKARALTWLTGYFHFSAVVMHNLFHDRKPDPRTFFTGRFGALGAIEFLENLA
jgi:hypothetical protein